MSDDPRTGTLLKDYGEAPAKLSQRCVVLIGFPFDEGCTRNGGRAGACSGPEVARRYIKKIGTVTNPELGLSIADISLYDAGDCTGATLEEAHAALEAKVTEVFARGGIPFVIGGGNDESFPNVSALMSQTKEKIAVVNIDAHLDVRPLKEGKVHSGSPFFLMMNDERFKKAGSLFVEYAAQGSQCSAVHADFVKNNGGMITWLSSLKDVDVGNSFNHLLNTTFATATGGIFVSFDLDSVASAYAPGVSCPGTVGLSAEDALAICMEAGSCGQVKLVDLSEFNPRIEEDRTGRLVAQMFYHFLLGLSKRPKA